MTLKKKKKNTLQGRNLQNIFLPTRRTLPIPSPGSISFPSTYRIHVGQLLSHQVCVEQQEVLLDLNLHFLLFSQAERTIAKKTNWKQAAHLKCDHQDKKILLGRTLKIYIEKVYRFVSYHQCHPCWPDSAVAQGDPGPVWEPLTQAGLCAGIPSACGDRGSLEAPGSLQDTGPARHAVSSLVHCGNHIVVRAGTDRKTDAVSNCEMLPRDTDDRFQNKSHFLMAPLVSELRHLVSCSLSSTFPYLQQRTKKTYFIKTNHYTLLSINYFSFSSPPRLPV